MVVVYTGLAFRIEVWAGEVGRGQHMAIVQTRRLHEVTKRVGVDGKEEFQGLSHGGLQHSKMSGRRRPSKGD